MDDYDIRILELIKKRDSLTNDELGEIEEIRMHRKRGKRTSDYTSCNSVVNL